jgi:hypothetical protein
MPRFGSRSDCASAGWQLRRLDRRPVVEVELSN